MTDRVIVRTGDGQSLSELAAALIGLADDPHEVVWEHRAGHLTVPEYVAARYADGMTAVEPAAETAETPPADDTPAAVVAAPEPPVRRKPGRPRKQTEAAVKDEVN